MNKKILLSGVKPTGRPHIGNYFGAMRQLVDLQDEYQVYAMAVDYHALISVHDAKTLNQDLLDLAIDYLAIGIDPKKTLLFKQSDVQEHTELAWIFDCITTMPFLMEAHAFKASIDPHASLNPHDISLKAKLARAEYAKVNAGLFGYPVLMAADILMYDVDVVPVGKDNKQHLEMTREIARKFNATFKPIFKEPGEMIVSEVAIVPGTDGRKMSKSYGNTIPLFATYDEITKAVMSIVTDSKGVDEQKNPDEDNVFKLHKLFVQGSTLMEIRERYEKGGLGHKESKEILIKNIETFIAPLREKRQIIANDTDFVLDVLKEGGKRAKQKAERKMEAVREAIGVKLY